MSKSSDADPPLRQEARPARPEAAPRRRHMSITSVALLLFAVVTAATGQVMLKHGMQIATTAWLMTADRWRCARPPRRGCCSGW